MRDAWNYIFNNPEDKLDFRFICKLLDLFCFITYNQLFWDGNKRTALTAANKLLLDNGCGMIIIKDENMQEFNEHLLHMYETEDKAPLKDFLYNKALLGIDFA